MPILGFVRKRNDVIGHFGVPFEYLVSFIYVLKKKGKNGLKQKPGNNLIRVYERKNTRAGKL